MEGMHRILAVLIDWYSSAVEAVSHCFLTDKGMGDVLGVEGI